MDIDSGNLVKISSPDNFTGFKLGIVEGICKKCSGFKVFLADKEAPVRHLCIKEPKDTIVKITK